jgi:hypothetical protein
MLRDKNLRKMYIDIDCTINQSDIHISLFELNRLYEQIDIAKLLRGKKLVINAIKWTINGTNDNINKMIDILKIIYCESIILNHNNILSNIPYIDNVQEPGTIIKLVKLIEENMTIDNQKLYKIIYKIFSTGAIAFVCEMYSVDFEQIFSYGLNNNLVNHIAYDYLADKISDPNSYDYSVLSNEKNCFANYKFINKLIDNGLDITKIERKDYFVIILDLEKHNLKHISNLKISIDNIVEILAEIKIDCLDEFLSCCNYATITDYNYDKSVTDRVKIIEQHSLPSKKNILLFLARYFSECR